MREVTLKCSRCHKEYPSSDMRYVSSNVMCCKNCIETPEKNVTKPAEKAVEKMEFRCTKCNYSFKRNVMPNACPYCAKKGTLVMKAGMKVDNFLAD